MTTEEPRSTGRAALRVVLGLALLAPAGLCWISGLVVPTIETVITSLQEASPLQDAQFVGLENYIRLSQDPLFSNALSFTLSLLMVRVLVVTVVPLLLAFAVNELGRTVRVLVRLLLTVPLALFAPVTTALAWTMVSRQLLANPERVGVAFRLIDGLTTFGLACGVGLVVYLTALRGPGEDAPSWKKVWMPVAASWMAGLLATIALTLQSFTMSYVLTGGGPGSATTTFAVFQFMQAFQYMRFGTAATVATFTLIVLVLLGLAVGLIVVLTGLRLETVPWDKESRLFSGEGRPTQGRTVAIVLLAVMLLVSVGICSPSALPLPWSLSNSLKTEAEVAGSPSSLFPSSPSLDAYAEIGQVMRIPIGRVLINSILSSLLVLLLQIPIAYLGALGIGAMRPFGRRSELLLLLFSPWLFVTTGPLSIAAFETARSVGLLNTRIGLAFPAVFSIPALFILTLFFKGQEPKWCATQAESKSGASAFFSKLILPSLPLVLLLACVSLLINLQSLLWPLIATANAENFTFNLALLFLRNSPIPSWPILAAGLTLFELPTFVFFFLAFGLFQTLYLDRLALVTSLSDVKE